MARRTNAWAGDPLDALFQVALPEFVKARNALASTLKKSGRTHEAAAVQSLPKPPASAWGVNQLHWRHRRDLDALLAAGDRFRDAQRAQMAGRQGDLRAALEARHASLSDMTTRVSDVLRQAGHAPTPDLMRRVATTLDALATYGTLPDAPPVGRLTADLETPGFETLATLIPVDGGTRRGDGAPPRVIPFAGTHPRKQDKVQEPRGGSKGPVSDAEAKRRLEAQRRSERAAVRKVLDAAEKALREARLAARHAEAALKQAAGRAKAAERDRLGAEQRLSQASEAFEQSTREARRVAREAETAAQEVSDAERALEKARRAIEDGGA